MGSTKIDGLYLMEGENCFKREETLEIVNVPKRQESMNIQIVHILVFTEM